MSLTKKWEPEGMCAVICLDGKMTAYGLFDATAESKLRRLPDLIRGDGTD